MVSEGTLDQADQMSDPSRPVCSPPGVQVLMTVLRQRHRAVAQLCNFYRHQLIWNKPSVVLINQQSESRYPPAVWTRFVCSLCCQGDEKRREKKDVELADWRRPPCFMRKSTRSCADVSLIRD